MSTIPVRKQRPRSEKQIDQTIAESFPASDPPSYSRSARLGAPSRGEPPNRVEREDAKTQDQTGGKDSAE